MGLLLCFGTTKELKRRVQQPDISNQCNRQLFLSKRAAWKGAKTNSWLCHCGSNGTLELELELIQTQMTQKPMLRAEVHAHAMRASQNREIGSALREGNIARLALYKVETVHELNFGTRLRSLLRLYLH